MQLQRIVQMCPKLLELGLRSSPFNVAPIFFLSWHPTTQSFKVVCDAFAHPQNIWQTSAF
jgi:hypothetical protein